MGIDAEIYVVNTGPEMTEDDLRLLSIRLYKACDPSWFSISHPREWSWKKEGRHALTIATAEELEYVDLPDAPEGQIIEIHLTGRYYGEGYERGRLWEYVWIAEMVERLIPGCSIYYGGDSDSEKERFDHARRRSLIEHLLSTHGHDYSSSWDNIMNRGGVKNPTCELCQVPMQCNGGSGDGMTRFFWCYCGLSIETRDAGETYMTRGQNPKRWPFTLDKPRSGATEE